MLQVEVINVIISLATSALSVLLVARAWKQRDVEGAMWFIGLVAAVGWVTWWYAFEAVVGFDIEAYVALSKVEYIGLSLIPLFWLGFALKFSGRERLLSKTGLRYLAIVPIITIVLALTNEFHGLIWKNPRFNPAYNVAIFDPDYGTWFWVYVVFSYMIFLFGSVILFRHAMTTWRLYRVQTLLILAGTTLPWISNLANIFDNLNPFPFLYLNAICLGASVLCFAIALFRLRLLEVAPLAYDTILNNVPDGIIVVDHEDRVVAVNTYIKPYLENPKREPVGQPLTAAFARFAEHLELSRDIIDHKYEFETDDKVFEVRVSPVFDRQASMRGRLFVISDVTVKAQAEKARQDEQRFSETMRTIGSTLNSTLDTYRVLSLIQGSLDQLIPHICSNIMLVDEDEFTTRVQQHQGYTAEEASRLDKLVFDYREFPLFLSAAQSGVPFIVPDTSQEPGWVKVAGLDMAHSFACMPILMDSKLFGFINIDSAERDIMTPEMVTRLQIYGQQAGLAIKNARLYEKTFQQAEELKRRVGSLTTTQQVYKEIGFSLNIHLLLELVLDAVLRISMADAGFVALAQGNVLKIGQQYGNYDLDDLKLILEKQSGIVGNTIAEKHMLMTQDADEIVSAVPNTKAQIALPLFSQGEDEKENFYGVIVLETKNPKRFTEDRVQLLTLIADRVAVALNNIRLMTALRERATELEILYDKLRYLENFKSEMIRIAAHDLKNPLNVIRNYLSMLVDEDEFDLDLQKIYPAMLRSSERMLQIIQNFLSLDRIERAAEHQTAEPFDLARVASKVVEEFASRAGQKSRQIDISVPDHACMVKGDPAQIYEAISNFVSNAVKYTPDGAYIGVSLKVKDEVAYLEVNDNGFGIPEAQQEKLFQPFYRAQTQETSQIDGSGLGLHLTRNIIERQGGEIIFRSVYQQGSTFGFHMPLYTPEKVEATN